MSGRSLVETDKNHAKSVRMAYLNRHLNQVSPKYEAGVPTNQMQHLIPDDMRLQKKKKPPTHSTLLSYNWRMT
jgi:hypothetical protein